MKAFLTWVFRWSHSPWDGLVRVAVALAMVLPAAPYLPSTPARLVIAGALLLQVLFSVLVVISAGLVHSGRLKLQ